MLINNGGSDISLPLDEKMYTSIMLNLSWGDKIIYIMNNEIELLIGTISRKTMSDWAWTIIHVPNIQIRETFVECKSSR